MLCCGVQVLWCASPAGYMCAITSHMHAVCDERGNYLFKSVGPLAGRPRPWQGRSRQSARWTLGITWVPSMRWSCTQTVWALSTQRAQALSISCRSPIPLMWFWGSRSRTDRNNAHSWQRMETYVIHMYGCVQLLASLSYCIMDCVSDPALEIHIRMVAQMKGRSLHTMHICTFDAQLNLG